MQRSAGLLLAVLGALAPLAGLVVLRDRAEAEDSAKPPKKEASTTVGDDPAAACAAGPIAAFADYLGSGWNGDLKDRFRPVVVTIADPVDSRLDAAFDETLTALELAATQLGYTLDRYWMPWQLDRRQLEAGRKPDECRRQQPGVVLYRPRKDVRDALAQKGLAFLLVGETPTTGIQSTALRSALDLVKAADASQHITVLGPSFSGTAASLARELRQDRYQDQRFDVVTGSATAEDRGLLSDPPQQTASLSRIGAPAFLSLRSTVHPDSQLWDTALAYLRQLHIDSDDVALLMETGSAYTGGFHRLIAKGVPPRTILRFPMQISRVRTDYDHQRAQQQVVVAGQPLPALALGLRSDAKRDAKDVLPTLSSTSENYDDQVLAAELALLRRHSIRAVGVLATDPLDKIFLTSKIREFVPDALIFTFESNLLFVHPDVQRAMYGTLVVSTYPLFIDAQAWSVLGPLHGRLQFASSAAQGIYNSAILALEPRFEQQPHAKSLMLDYGCPFPVKPPDEGACRPTADASPFRQRPPVWISVVGRDALWPIWIDGCDDAKKAQDGCAEGITCWTGSADLRPRVHPPHASRGMRLLAALVVAFTAFATLSAFGARALDAPFGAYALPRSTARAHSVWLGLHFGWLALAVLTLSVTLSIPDVVRFDRSLLADDEAQGWLDRLANATAPATAIAAGLALAAAGWGFARALHARSRPASARRWLEMGVVTLALAGTSYLVAPLIAAFALRWLGTARTLMIFERISDLGSGVSPMLPLLFLAVTVHLATYDRLVRARLLGTYGASPRGEEGLFSRFLGVQDPDFARVDAEVARLVRGPWSLRHTLLAAVFVLVPLSLLAYAWPRFHSPDGRGFDRLFVGLLTLVIAIAGSSLWRTWRMWCALRGVLERLPSHPVGAALERVPQLLGPERVRRLFWRGPQLQDLEACYRAFCASSPTPHRPDLRQRIASSLDADRRAPARFCWDHASLAPFADAAAAEAQALEHGTARYVASGARASATEDFVATQLALTVFWALAHLRWLLAFSVLGAVSILGALAFYPFQPMHHLQLLVWIVVLGAAVSSIVIYVQHDRNEVLSWLSGTPAGQVTFDVSHVLRFVSLGVTPIVALLALEFPTLGHWIARWFGPLFGALK